MQGTALPPPQGPRNAEAQAAEQLRKVIDGLRKHSSKLYRQLRKGAEFDKDVARIILDTVDKVTGGMPWPVGLAVQAVLFLGKNAVQLEDNVTDRDSLRSTIEDLTQQLQMLEGLGVGVLNEHSEKAKEIVMKLIASSVVVAPRRRSVRGFICASFDAKDLSDLKADLEKWLGNIRGIIASITADRVERPCREVPELPALLVRMDERVSKVMGFLKDSGESTRVVGLHGQGGIGKTTLMEALLKELRLSQDDGGNRTTREIASVQAGMRALSLKGLQKSFDNRTIHEFAHVEVGVKPQSLKDLQKSLYSQLSGGSNVSFSSEGQGREALKVLMKKLQDKGKKICLSLDDVWELEHLKKLLPQHDLWDALPCGSYLIISSRSAHVAAGLAGMCFNTKKEQEKGYLDYELPLLPQQDAEDLFLDNARRKEEDTPLQRNDPLVQAIVPRCDGLPLALAVYGSYFKDWERRKPEVWKKVLEQLERAEDPCYAECRMFQKLKASVDFQTQRWQDGFLDVALLARFVSFSHSENVNVGTIDKALELVMEKADVDYLVDQSLVSRSGDEVKIHDLLLNVAKQMAREKKIWSVTSDASQDEIDEFLHPELHNEVPSIKVFDERKWCRHAKTSYPSSDQMKEVIYLRLDDEQSHPLVNQRREFILMITKHCYKLRILEVQLDDTLEDILVQEQLSWIANLTQLRWLSVKGDSFAGISEIASKLKSFNMCLRNNGNVHHDFLSSFKTSFTTLHRLCIKGLENAMNLHSVKQLGSLTHLDFSGCMRLAELPQELGQLRSLTQLDLSSCTSLAKLAKELGQLVSLTKLFLYGCTSLVEVPKELGQLGSLTQLDLDRCTSLVKVPKELGQLGSLTELRLHGCTSLVEVPKELGQLGSLTVLRLDGCTSLVEVPKELGQLGSLTLLRLNGCTSLVEVPKELGQLGSLTKLFLHGCTSLVEVPKELGQLGSLTQLDLSECTRLAHLPEEVWQLNSLDQVIDISGCTSLLARGISPPQL